MFRATDTQMSFFDAAGLMTAEKRAACEKSWAGKFRQEVWPILLKAEPEFRELYDETMGRPNRSVALVLSLLMIKEINDWTDQEALDALEFDTRLWYAMDLETAESGLCQKTLHNFRVGLIKHEKGQTVFRRITNELLRILGVDISRQRLDSTHILSNFAVLNRLCLFCETLGILLNTMKKPYRDLYERVETGILKRYGEESKNKYQDAKRGQGQRRLEVAARDAYRLVEQFKEHRTVSKLAEFKILQRLVAEQCVITEELQTPKDDDEDQQQPKVPVQLKSPAQLKSSFLQTPHDPGVSYSGHKGQGYEVQVAETCAENNPVNLITHVEVTPSCKADQNATVPVIKALIDAQLKPAEIVADTGFSGAENAAEAAKLGVNLLAPAPAKGKPKQGETYPAPAAACPTEKEQAKEWLKQQEAQPEFNKRYAIRAGIESTNSELKRAHGMRKLRVRTEKRVKLSVYLKVAACNLKRALRYWLFEPKDVPETCALPA